MINRKVMIVDDDKEFLEELEEILVLSGYEMIALNDSLLALETAAKEKPDVIVLDLRMPGKNGFQIADELRGVPQLTDIPVIIMTGDLRDEYGPLIKMCDIKRCLKKPFNPLDIINEIEAVSQ